MLDIIKIEKCCALCDNLYGKYGYNFCSEEPREFLDDAELNLDDVCDHWVIHEDLIKRLNDGKKRL